MSSSVTCPKCQRKGPGGRPLCAFCDEQLVRNPCPACARELPQGGGACQFCGARPAGPAPSVCPACRKGVKPGLPACPWCAADLAAASPAAAGGPEPGAPASTPGQALADAGAPPPPPAVTPSTRKPAVGAAGQAPAFEVTLRGARGADDGLDRSQRLFVGLLLACMALAGAFAVARGALRDTRPRRADFFGEAPLEVTPGRQPGAEALLRPGGPAPATGPTVEVPRRKPAGTCAYRDCPARAAGTHRVVIDTGQIGHERGRTTIYLAELDLELCAEHRRCAREGSWPTRGLPFMNVAVVLFVAVVGGLVLFAPVALAWKALAASGRAPPFPTAG